MKTTWMVVALGAGLALAAAPRAGGQQAGQAGQAQQAASQPAANMNPAEVDAAIERTRADLRASKVDVISKNMNFTGQESAEFWPIYHEYQAKLTRINDEKVALVREYANAGANLSDEQAKDMTQRWFGMQGQTLDLQKEYYGKMSDKLSPKVATRFFQLEHRLNLLVDLKLAASLPLALDQPAGPGGGK